MLWCSAWRLGRELGVVGAHNRRNQERQAENRERRTVSEGRRERRDTEALLWSKADAERTQARDCRRIESPVRKRATAVLATLRRGTTHLRRRA